MIYKRLKRRVLLSVLPFAAIIWAVSAAKADIVLPALFNDGMVLQQETEAALFGWADPGEEVTVRGSWDGMSVSATTDDAGIWRLKLRTPSAGGPYSLSIKGRNEIVLCDVLIGEVWLCSGQSNMEMSLSDYGGVLNSAEEIRRADYPAIRFFTVKNRCSPAPQKDCEGAWVPCTPDSASAFSAAGYFFGRKIHETLGVPVGLISADWGGTPVESWMAKDAVKAFPEFDDALAVLDRGEEGEAAYTKAMDAWLKKLDALDAGPDTDHGAWKTMTLPTTWDKGGLGPYEGVVWFQKEVRIPPAWEGLDLVLDLGPIDESDTTWVNGAKVGERIGADQWRVPRTYTVPAEKVHPGINVIVVRVLNCFGAGGIYGKEEGLRIRRADDPSDAISLAGAWRYCEGREMKALDPIPEKKGIGAHTPTTLYNGMIAPLVPFRLCGVIWYQGEANRGRGLAYRALFPALIESWRAAWGQGDFPFYFVQIAPFHYDGLDGPALIREAQLMTLSLKNTGMVVTTDIGDPDNIHPTNKQEVGRRLALWALAKTYGHQSLVHSGPLYRSMKKEGAGIRVFFDHLGGGLKARGGPLTHFEIAGKDRRFFPAEAVIDGDTVLVRREGLFRPEAVRFGWCNAPVPNLFNAEGLPASPFRTDDWEEP